MAAKKQSISIPVHPAFLIALIPAAMLLFLRLAVMRPVVIQHHSMEPTLKPGDRVVLLEPRLWKYQPRRGDVVAVSDPMLPGGELVKRVIALEGEEVQVAGGAVYINRQPLWEAYLAAQVPYDLLPSVVPPGHLFLLGDNRATSEDSSVWGPLPANSVIGRVRSIYWPPARSGRVE